MEESVNKEPINPIMLNKHYLKPSSCDHDDVELVNTISHNAFQDSYVDHFICNDCGREQEVHWRKEGETDWRYNK